MMFMMRTYMFFRVILFMSVPAVIYSGQSPNYVCTAEGWINNGDTCYHVLDRTEKWHKVQALCDVLKAKFAYVDDESDMNALARAAALRSAPTVWLMGTNTDHQKVGKFVWRDGPRTEVNGAITPWAASFPDPNPPLDQFIYMKVDLESRQAAGLGHSVDRIERYVACMLPAKDLTQAETHRLVKISEDPLMHSTHPARSRRRQKRSRQQHRDKQERLFDQDARRVRRRKRKHIARLQFARADDDNRDVARSAGRMSDGIVDTSNSVGKRASHSASGVKKAIVGSGSRSSFSLLCLIGTISASLLWIQSI